jgi:pimeloyl-ACP methyl ester carboxylesterase
MIDLNSDYQLNKEIININGVNITVHSMGKGLPLLYLHSIFGETGSQIFFKMLAQLGYEVKIPAICGFPGSDFLNNYRGMQDLVYFFRQLTKELFNDRFILIGSSFGGWLAAEFATFYAETIDKMILISPFGLSIDQGQTFDIFYSSYHELWQKAFYNNSDLSQLLSGSYDEKDPNGFKIHALASMQATACYGWNPYMHNPKLKERLGSINCPGLVLSGKNDGVLPSRIPIEFSRLIPGCIYEELSDCGHVGVLDNPSAVINCLEEFL